ncbi:hypothetical protein CKF54_06795 [Psittacicella hinzii]|uniref:UvrABC system protein A n=1 Tax=Psittacicella hinzii TaxID=2028575 RepID=A0A3A1Y5C0_9GAMM|nr:hypothetical protein [Psittacicella hinzii]RIY31367.1 hypothetical protein CKF54_06795 [Psittacicella hinzii]
MQENKFIHLQNAYVNNLHIPDLKIPLNQFVVLSGPSGSGKTTLIKDILIPKSQEILNLSPQSFNISSYYNNNKRLQVTGITPIQYLSQRFINKNKRLNLAQLLGIDHPLNLLFTYFATFNNQEGNQALTYETLVKLIEDSPAPDEQFYEVVKDRIQQRFYLTMPVPLALIPSVQKLDFSSAKDLSKEEIVDFNKKILNIIEDFYSSYLDIVIINKKHLFDFYDLKDFEVNDLPFAIESIDVSFNKFRNGKVLSEDFLVELQSDFYEVLQFQEKLFQDLFNQNASLLTNLTSLGLTELDKKEVTDYSNKNFNALRLVYPPQIGFYSPLNKKVEDHSLISTVSSGDKEQILDLKNPSTFSTYGKHRCQSCGGTGIDPVEDNSTKDLCSTCFGTGLAEHIFQATFADKNYAELYNLTLEKLHSFLKAQITTIEDEQANSSIIDLEAFKNALIGEIVEKLEHLIDINITYLNLARKIDTLSGGEVQRILLSKILSSQTTNVTYILDEPSIGLHPADNHRLIKKIRQLVEKGNSVIAIEHDRDFIEQADYLIYLNEGNILFNDQRANLDKADLALNKYLKFEQPISQVLSEVNNFEYNQELDSLRATIDQESLKVALVNTNYKRTFTLEKIEEYAKEQGVAVKTLVSPEYRAQKLKDHTKIVYKNINVGYFEQETITLVRNAINVITGVSGSGKSIFADKVLYAATEACLKIKEKEFETKRCLPKDLQKKFKLDNILGIGFEKKSRLSRFDRVLYASQSIGKNDYSKTLLKFIEMDEELATLFYENSAMLQREQKGKAKNLTAKDFVVKRKYTKNLCPECKGKQFITINLEEDNVEKVTCFECNGAGFAPYVLAETIAYDPNSSVKYNISEFSNLTVDQAFDFLIKYHKRNPSLNLKNIILKLGYLKRFRLGHLNLNRYLSNISGGELQRLYLIKEISITDVKTRRKNPECLIIIDEPSTGLHFDDIQSMLDFMVELKNEGHTLVIIEHNVDLIYNCDYLVEFGPGSAEKGGKVIFSGTIKDLLDTVNSKNSPYLSSIMQEISNYHLNYQKIIEHLN